MGFPPGTFYKAKAVVILGMDGRRDPGVLSHHAFQMDQGLWQCWDVTYIPTGTTIEQTTDMSASARFANFGGNQVQTFPNLVVEKCVHVDDPRVGSQRFIFAEEGEVGEQRLLDYWNRAQQAMLAGDTSQIAGGDAPNISTGQESADAAPQPVGITTQPLNPQIPVGVVEEPVPVHELTKAERKDRRKEGLD